MSLLSTPNGTGARLSPTPAPSLQRALSFDVVCLTRVVCYTSFNVIAGFRSVYWYPSPSFRATGCRPPTEEGASVVVSATFSHLRNAERPSCASVLVWDASTCRVLYGAGTYRRRPATVWDVSCWARDDFRCWRNRYAACLLCCRFCCLPCSHTFCNTFRFRHVISFEFCFRRWIFVFPCNSAALKCRIVCTRRCCSIWSPVITCRSGDAHCSSQPTVHLSNSVDARARPPLTCTGCCRQSSTSCDDSSGLNGIHTVPVRFSVFVGPRAVRVPIGVPVRSDCYSGSCSTTAKSCRAGYRPCCSCPCFNVASSCSTSNHDGSVDAKRTGDASIRASATTDQ